MKPFHSKSLERVAYDSSTKAWFKRNPLAETTVVKCAICGLMYRPSLGHKCKRRPEEGTT